MVSVGGGEGSGLKGVDLHPSKTSTGRKTLRVFVGIALRGGVIPPFRSDPGGCWFCLDPPIDHAIGHMDGQILPSGNPRSLECGDKFPSLERSAAEGTGSVLAIPAWHLRGRRLPSAGGGSWSIGDMEGLERRSTYGSESSAVSVRSHGPFAHRLAGG